MAASFLQSPAQPGEGSFLLRPESQSYRSRNPVPSFLEHNRNESNDVDVQVGAGDCVQSFLRVTDHMRKERRDHAGRPATMENNDLTQFPTSSPRRTLHSQNRNWTSLSTSQPTTFLRDLDNTNYRLSTETGPSSDNDDMTTPFVPPHLRKRPVVPTTSQEVDSTRIANEPPRPQPDSNIRQDQADGGVDISWTPDVIPAQQTLAARPAPNDPWGTTDVTATAKAKPLTAIWDEALKNKKADKKNHQAASRNQSQQVPRNQSQQASRSGGRGGRGRGQVDGSQNRGKRTSKWPTNAEQRPDPHRWDLKWESESEKNVSSNGGWTSNPCADNNFGWGESTKKKGDGVKLTDWSGGFAPAPVDWDSRPAFRDGQSAERIYQWKDYMEEVLCGKKLSVPQEQIDVRAIDTQPDSGFVLPDVAPRYWVPIVMGKMAPSTFWKKEIIDQPSPAPYNGDDLINATPWWNTYQDQTSCLLTPVEAPVEMGVDPEEETTDERLARENDRGSDFATANRKAFEKAKRAHKAEKEARRKAKQERIAKMNNDLALPPREKLTDLKLYIRAAKAEDLAAITEIYNYYVKFTTAIPGTDTLSVSAVKAKIQEVRSHSFPFLVACLRGEVLKGRNRGRGKRRQQGEQIILPDKIIGFALADYHNSGGPGISKTTGDLELFVSRDHYLHGVGKCLMDKLLGLFDDCYCEKGGYEVEGDEAEGVGSKRRTLQNLVIEMPYDKPETLEWKKRWLVNWAGFEYVGDLDSLGLKDGKTINVALFQRKTGTEMGNAISEPSKDGYF